MEDKLLQSHLDQLTPLFRDKIETLVRRCTMRGIHLSPRESLRSPLLQAKYWRRSRQQPEIDEKVCQLKTSGACFLAECIELAGRQEGNHITNAIPGMSWHQWGEAIDFVWVVNGRVIWDITTLVENVNGYQIYGEEALLLDLDCGLYWPGFVDACHVQLRTAPNPSAIYSLEYINKEMELRFRDKVYVS